MRTRNKIEIRREGVNWLENEPCFAVHVFRSLIARGERLGEAVDRDTVKTVSWKGGSFLDAVEKRDSRTIERAVVC